MGGFIVSPPPTLEASEDEDNDDDATAFGRFLLGGVCTLRDVVRNYVFFFSFLLLEIHYIVIANIVLMMLYI